MPVGDPGDDELGAHLMSADDQTLAAHIVEPADTFDPDDAFRVLDSLRARSEMVLGWVEESLAVAPTPRLAKRKLPASTAPWLATGALAVGVLLAPASFIVQAGPLNYVAVTLLAAGWLAYLDVRQGRFGNSSGGCIAAVALPVVSLVIAVLAMLNLGADARIAAHRLLLVLVGAFLFLRAYHWRRNRAAERDAPRRPTEHRAADHQEGVYEPAVHFQPELILMDRDLHVAIECGAEDGRVLRLPTLAVDTATREYADEMGRMARGERRDHAPSRRGAGEGSRIRRGAAAAPGA